MLTGNPQWAQITHHAGESEKLIRMLFDLARHYAPSTIFFDEIDSIMGHRGGVQGSMAGNEGSEHEGSRRMKTEILIQMDGLLGNNSDIFVLAASNLPWDLDAAFLRRMEKRIMIPLPDSNGRKEMIRSHLSEFSSTFNNDEYLGRCAAKTEAMSGADIRILCKECSMKPLRRMIDKLETLDSKGNITGSSEQNMSLLVKRNPVTEDDFDEALASFRSSNDEDLHTRHENWNSQHKSC